jgi:dihydrofolate reductase
MGKLILNAAVTVNGAFEAPVPEPHGWFVMDPESNQDALERWQAADAMVLGRKTYEGLAAVWPQLAAVPGYEAYAHRMNSMMKYVATRTLKGPLTWGASLLHGDLAESVRRITEEHDGNLIISGAGELARTLVRENLVDEFWFTLYPYLWPSGPRILDDVVATRLELISTKTYPSGVVQLCYRRANSGTPSDG